MQNVVLERKSNYNSIKYICQLTFTIVAVRLLFRWIFINLNLFKCSFLAVHREITWSNLPENNHFLTGAQNTCRNLFQTHGTSSTTHWPRSLSDQCLSTWLGIYYPDNCQRIPNVRFSACSQPEG